MKFRNTIAVAALLLGAAFASGAGINDNYDGFITVMQAARPQLPSTSDQAKIDAAIALLQAAPTDVGSVTANVKVMQKVVKGLGALSTNPLIADALKARIAEQHIYVVGRGSSGGAAASQKEHNPFKLMKVALNFGKQRAKMDAVDANTTKTLAKRLAVYLKAAKSFDKVVKKYGTL